MTINPVEPFRRLLTRIAGRCRCWVRALSLTIGMLCSIFAVNPASHAASIGDFGDEPVRACYTYYNRVFLTEYYNEILNQFFYTDPCFNDEQVILSGAAGPGWSRTHWEFGVWHAMLTFGPVCRFYGSVWPGPNSHFFTSDAQECSSLQALPKGPPDQPRWNLESVRAFNVVQLNAEGTGCDRPSGKKLIRRFYNNGHQTGRDANHRFVSDDEVDLRNEMLRKGWVDEGVRFCVTGVYFNAVKRP